MKTRMLAAIAALTLISGVAARADDTVQTQLNAAYMHQCDTIKASDPAAYGKTLTPDFTSTDPNGKVETLAENLADMKNALSVLSVTSCTLSFVSVTTAASGDTIASIVFSQIGTYGKTSPVNLTARETDTWTKASGAWLQSKSVTMEQTISINGKVVQHSGTPASPAP